MTVTAATLLRAEFDPLLHTRSPWLFHVLAVAIVSAQCGRISGLIATALSVLSALYWFIPPPGIWVPPSPEDAVAIGLFAAVGLALSWYGGIRRDREQALQAAYDELARTRAAEDILAGLLRMCSSCRRIHKDDQWYPVEAYLHLQGGAKFTHGLCPECLKQWSPKK